jgi:hypothetical protein
MSFKNKPFRLIILFSALLLSSCATTPFSRAHQHCENLADEKFPLVSRFDVMPRVGVSLSNDRSMIHWMLDMHERSDRQNFIQECLKKECVYQTGNEDCHEPKAG